MDTMIQKLEKYADNLESIVQQRTAELADEKHKTDMLLCRMLPPYVQYSRASTSIGCRKWIRIKRIVLYLEVYAQCDKLAGQGRRSNVDRRKYYQLTSTDYGRQFITLRLDHLRRTKLQLQHYATIDLYWRLFRSPEFGTKF